MAEYRGSSGPDVVTVDNNDRFHGMDGDDRITVVYGTAQGNAGNDTIIGAGDPNPNNWWRVTVWYWERPNATGAIRVDLEAGTAEDGYGGRDTLVNIHNVHGFSRNGDQGLGSSQADYFYIGQPPQNQAQGKVLIDGRGGSDQVSMGLVTDRANGSYRGDPVFSASADGRTVWMHYTLQPDFVFELRNIERINIWNPDTQSSSDLYPQNLIDPTTIGAQTLLGGGKGWQAGALGTPVALTYSFMSAAPAHGGGEGGSGFTAFSASQQQVVRELLAKLQQQTGLSFTEVATGGQLQFGVNQQTATRGYAFNPSEVGDARAGDVWLDVETLQRLAPGEEGYYVLLHEVGHALGLAHPLPQSDTSGKTVLLDRWADLSFTIMVDAGSASAWPSWYSAFDLQALRHLYGTRAVAATDTVYRLSDATGQQRAGLLDDGGTDTLDASACSVGALLDLRPGQASSVGLTAGGSAAIENLVITPGSWIERAVGSAFDDVLVGNERSNRLEGGRGNDLIDGQGGTDWAVFAATRASYDVGRATYGGDWTVAARDGSAGVDELQSIERLRFADSALALDIGASQPAGQAALLMGAVLGRNLMLAKPELMGAVIDLFDQGFSLNVLSGALMNMSVFGEVWTILAGDTGANAVARYLHKQVHGSDPDAATLAQAVAAMTSQPQGAYLAQLAASQANQTQVGLVGLADTGLEFVPVGG